MLNANNHLIMHRIAKQLGLSTEHKIVPLCTVADVKLHVIMYKNYCKVQINTILVLCWVANLMFKMKSGSRNKERDLQNYISKLKSH